MEVPWKQAQGSRAGGALGRERCRRKHRGQGRGRFDKGRCEPRLFLGRHAGPVRLVVERRRRREATEQALPETDRPHRLRKPRAVSPSDQIQPWRSPYTYQLSVIHRHQRQLIRGQAKCAPLRRGALTLLQDFPSQDERYRIPAATDGAYIPQTPLPGIVCTPASRWDGRIPLGKRMIAEEARGHDSRTRVSWGEGSWGEAGRSSVQKNNESIMMVVILMAVG